MGELPHRGDHGLCMFMPFLAPSTRLKELSKPTSVLSVAVKNGRLGKQPHHLPCYIKEQNYFHCICHMFEAPTAMERHLKAEY